MSEADRQRWDERYANGAHDHDIATPRAPDALFGRLDLLPKQGRALEVACGRGATAVWLAQHGLSVDAVDVSKLALASAQQLATAHGVADRLRVWAHDLDEGLPVGLGGGFALVVCERFRDPRLYVALRSAMAASGLLAITVLSSASGPAGAFRAQPGELLREFAGLRVIEHRDVDGQASLLAQAV